MNTNIRKEIHNIIDEIPEQYLTTLKALLITNFTEQEIFYMKFDHPDSELKADAKGKLTPHGFLVLKGSKANAKALEGCCTTRLIEIRNKLIKENILTPKDGYLEFTQDHLFDDPTYAGSAVLGAMSYGKKDWKTKNGTLLCDYEKRYATTTQNPTYDTLIFENIPNTFNK